jgi:hypothetical protein
MYYKDYLNSMDDYDAIALEVALERLDKRKLTPFEREFVEDIRANALPARATSDKQDAVLNKILYSQRISPNDPWARRDVERRYQQWEQTPPRPRPVLRFRGSLGISR